MLINTRASGRQRSATEVVAFALTFPSLDKLILGVGVSVGSTLGNRPSPAP